MNSPNSRRNSCHPRDGSRRLERCVRRRLTSSIRWSVTSSRGRTTAIGDNEHCAVSPGSGRCRARPDGLPLRPRPPRGVLRRIRPPRRQGDAARSTRSRPRAPRRRAPDRIRRPRRRPPSVRAGPHGRCSSATSSGDGSASAPVSAMRELPNRSVSSGPASTRSRVANRGCRSANVPTASTSPTSSPIEILPSTERRTTAAARNSTAPSAASPVSARIASDALRSRSRVIIRTFSAPTAASSFPSALLSLSCRSPPRPRALRVRARCEHAPAYPAHVRRARGRSHAVAGGSAARPAGW